MRRRRKDQYGEYNYGQPATDMMTGLVFVLMLIVALLGLYLLSDYTGYKYDETEGVEETTAQETRPDDDGWSWKEYKGNGDHEDVGDGAGDGGGSGQEQPIIQTGGGGYGDEGIKSAVLPSWWMTKQTVLSRMRESALNCTAQTGDCKMEWEPFRS